MNIRTSHEAKRGCGFRKPGGLYLVGDGPSASCGKLPIPLDVCPTCGAGIHPTRGFTWIDGAKLFASVACDPDRASIPCETSDPSPCRLSDSRLAEDPTLGLVWIGEKYYATPADFLDESVRMGVSRRIPAVPKDFKIGTTWIAFAHRKTPGISECSACDGEGSVLDKTEVLGVEQEIFRPCEECAGTGKADGPAIFQLFCPRAIEYVVDDEHDDEAKLERLEKRGIELVRVIPINGKEAS